MSSPPISEPGFWQEQGYLCGRRLDGDLWLCVALMIFTFRVMVCDEGQVYDFCCFEKLPDAVACWADWDGETIPPGPWTRHHRSGLRQINGLLYEEDGITEKHT